MTTIEEQSNEREKQRAKFEAKRPNWKFNRMPNGDYYYTSVQDAWDTYNEGWQAAIASQQSQDAKDAEKYRWLRKKRNIGWKENIPWCVKLTREHSIPVSIAICGAELDAAIDAAMSEKGGAR